LLPLHIYVRTVWLPFPANQQAFTSIDEWLRNLQTTVEAAPAEEDVAPEDVCAAHVSAFLSDAKCMRIGHHVKNSLIATCIVSLAAHARLDHSAALDSHQYLSRW
jgi:hypothetical protein